jgi:hypothetical protein
MTNATVALTILSAMITPAVLILACASLAISTSNRVGRIMDRTREIRSLLERQVEHYPRPEMRDEEYELLYDQLYRAARRSELLHRALAGIYAAMGIFIAASVAVALPP